MNTEEIDGKESNKTRKEANLEHPRRSSDVYQRDRLVT